MLMNSDDAQFRRAVAIILELEGGGRLVDHPSDPGGKTKYGISQRAYPDLNIETLTKAEAERIYYNDYWLPVVGLSTVPSIRLALFDIAVNMGLSAARSLYGENPTLAELTAARLQRYTMLNHWWDFGRGWTRRVARILMEGQSMDDRFATSKVDLLIDNRPVGVRLGSALAGRSSDIAYKVRSMSSGPGVKMDIDKAK